MKKDLIKAGESTQNRKIKDLTKKEIETFCRLFEFTPNKALQKRLGFDENEMHRLINKLESEGIDLRKNSSFNKIAVPTKGGGVFTPGYLLTELMNSVAEEERREIMLMIEEGMEPVSLMREVIAVQMNRAMRGWHSEDANNGNIQKPVNDTWDSLANMIEKLDAMENGRKIVHGMDDSFGALVMETQTRGSPLYQEQVIDAEFEVKKDEDED